MVGQAAQFDLAAIGRAFTDIVAEVDDDFVRRSGLEKGRGAEATPIEILAIRSDLETYTLQPGGSPSNTTAGIAALGGKAAFFGKVCDDAGGRAFRNAFRQGGVLFETPDHPAESNAMSATCLVLMTPDDSVTMAYNRGVADRLTRADIDRDVIAQSSTLLVQGHLLASSESREAVEYAIDTAHKANRKVAISLNDLYLKGRADFLGLADFLIGNRREFRHNFPGRDLDDFARTDTIHVVTDGAHGAYIAGRDTLVTIPPISLVPSVEAAIPSYVGAGDQFAAGFLFGYARGMPYIDCGRLGAETATAVLRSASARPRGDWKGLAAKYVHEPSMFARPRPSAGTEP